MVNVKFIKQIRNLQKYPKFLTTVSEFIFFCYKSFVLIINIFDMNFCSFLIYLQLTKIIKLKTRVHKQIISFIHNPFFLLFVGYIYHQNHATPCPWGDSPIMALFS